MSRQHFQYHLFQIHPLCFSELSLLGGCVSSEGSTCFYSKCLYCNKENSLCTEGDSLEGTIIMWLPPTIHLKLARNPWRRTYREKLLAR